MDENPDFAQNYFSSTAIGIYKIGYESIKKRNGWHIVIDISIRRVSRAGGGEEDPMY